MSKNFTTYFVSFYPDEDAQGGAFRDNLIIHNKDIKNLRDIDFILRKSKEKGQELKAKSFAIFQMAMDRIWSVE